jgi:signal transduction histidine kinase
MVTVISHIIEFFRKLNDPEFIAYLEDDRRKFQILGFCILGMVQPFYIFIDKSMFPNQWTSWNFLGVRLLVAVLALVPLGVKSLRSKEMSFYIPGFVLNLGMAFMFNSYPFDSLTEAYQGASLTMIGASLLIFSSQKFFFIYSLAGYLVFYIIWWFAPPPSFEAWMTDGGFSNFTVTWIISNGFYTLRLYLLHKNYSLVKRLKSKSNELVHVVHELESIVNSLPQAVLLILRDPDTGKLTIDRNTSQALRQMFHSDLAGGEDPFEVIFAKSSLNSDQLNQLKTIMDSALGNDELQWIANIRLLPREFTIQQDRSAILIEADWNGIFDDHSELEKILLTMRDVTELRKLRSELDHKNIEASIIQEIIGVSPDRLHEFLRVTASSLNECLSLTRQSVADHDIYHILRNLHTIKGLSRNYNLERICSEIHEAESLVQEIKRHTPKDVDQLKKVIDNLLTVIQDYRDYTNRIYWNYKTSHSDRAVSDEEIKQVIHESIHHLQANRLQAAEERLTGLWQRVFYNLARTLRDEIAMTKNLANRLGKVPPNFEFLNDDTEIPEQLRVPLRKIFIHLFRNAIDHGIEPPTQRQKLGKPAAGTITVEVEHLTDGLRLNCRDDGQGFDLAKISASANQTECAQPKSIPNNPEAILNLIFQPNVSTAAQITDISGRGVGLDAVKSFIEDLGGHVQLLADNMSENSGTVQGYFHIKLPYHMELQDNVRVAQ